VAILLIWSVLLGAILGRFFKVWVLVPACMFLLAAVVVRSAWRARPAAPASRIRRADHKSSDRLRLRPAVTFGSERVGTPRNHGRPCALSRATSQHQRAIFPYDMAKLEAKAVPVKRRSALSRAMRGRDHTLEKRTNGRPWHCPRERASGNATQYQVSVFNWLASGQHFSRGALYLMLQNRIYRGDIVHQGTAYPGQHNTIIDPELWQIVQDKLAANRQERILAVGAEAPSLLAGLIVDADGVG
jgi:hypothetical protein